MADIEVRFRPPFFSFLQVTNLPRSRNGFEATPMPLAGLCL